MIPIDANELMKLEFEVLKIASNPPLHRLKMVYLVGPQGDDDAALFERAALINRKSDCLFAVFGHEGLQKVQYSGAQAWKRALMKYGISEDAIVLLPGTISDFGNGPSFNSLTEQFDLVGYALKMGFDDVGFIAPRWQMLRCVMSAVAANLKSEPVRVHPILAMPQPWNEVVRGSQGGMECQRVDLQKSEAFRVAQYMLKGDLPSVGHVRAYLDTLAR
jgi:hypothetical protein